MTVQSFLEEFFRARLSRMAVPSSTGRQLEASRDEVSHVRGTNPHAVEERHIRYAMMVKIWGKLTKVEQAVIFLQQAPTGPAEYAESFRAVWPDALDDLDDAVAACGAQVITRKIEVRARTHAEISKILGLSTSQVRSRVRSANNKMSSHPLMKAFK